MINFGKISPHEAHDDKCSNDKNNFIRFADSSFNAVEKQIFTIADDKKGNLWIGTDGGGILLFNKQHKTFTRLLSQIDKDGTIDNRINYLYQDSHDNFWINTMSGLICFDPNSNKFFKYTTADGLPNNVFFATAEDANGNRVEARMTAPEGYTTTAHTALNIMQKILDGNFQVGFQTPAKAYGADLILEIPGVSRQTA